MSQHVTAAQLITQAWKTAWEAGTLKAAMPVEYKNRRFQQPTDSAWARFTFLQGKTEPAALGQKRERTPFFITLQVFIPKGKGSKQARQAADITTALNYQVLTSNDRTITAHFQTASMEDGPEETGFASFNVTISGHYDSTRTT